MKDSIKLKLDRDQISYALLSGRSHMVSNGSHFPENLLLISAAWILLHDDIILATGTFISFVRVHLHNSYAAELCSILLALLFIEDSLSNVTMSHIHLNIATDCSAAIDLLNGPVLHSSIFNSAYDLTFKIS